MGRLLGVALGRVAGGAEVEHLRGEGAQSVRHWKCGNSGQRQGGEEAEIKEGSVASVGHVEREPWNTGPGR